MSTSLGCRRFFLALPTFFLSPQPSRILLSARLAWALNIKPNEHDPQPPENKRYATKRASSINYRQALITLRLIMIVRTLTSFHITYLLKARMIRRSLRSINAPTKRTIRNT
jgi:hypothetical protein